MGKTQDRSDAFRPAPSDSNITSASALAPLADALVSPELERTRTGPTGYKVTFRLNAPAATSVRIKGEWSFASPADIVADPTNPSARNGNTWRPGDLPIPSLLAGSASNWPVKNMTVDASGVWSFTTALPSGTFNYWYYINCTAAAPAMTGCTPIADPSNMPWTTAGTNETTSQVYVPSDPAFGTEDLSWQAPVAAAKRGTLEHATYTFLGHANPVDKNYVSVYLPAGYDPQRTKPYPTYYVNHGGGGNEMNWSTQGALDNIMDNLLANGQIEPTVIVMPNNPTTVEILDVLIPWVEGHYNVSISAQDRALSGLSGGGTVIQDILFNHTTKFAYYGVWSVPRGLPVLGEELNPELKQLRGLQIGVGIQDLGGLAQGNTTAEQALLRGAGVPFREYNVDGAHTWSYWRATLRDFLTEVVYPPAPVDTRVAPRITANPVAATTVTAKSKVTLRAAASGQPAPTVQWQVSHNSGKSWSPIAGAKSTTYAFTATAKQSGDRFRAAFTNSKGTVYTTASKLTVKTATKVTVKLAKKKVTTKARAKVTVTITPRSGKPTGTVTVKYGSKTKKVKITAAKGGKVVITLPKLKKGSYKITATYSGSASFVSSKSAKKTLTVKK